MTGRREVRGARLKALRQARFPSESGRKFAKRAGLSYSHLNRIESGKTSPTVPTLERLAQALKVPLSELLTLYAA